MNGGWWRSGTGAEEVEVVVEEGAVVEDARCPR
jgi:hypothetical protein